MSEAPVADRVEESDLVKDMTEIWERHLSIPINDITQPLTAYASHHAIVSHAARILKELDLPIPESGCYFDTLDEFIDYVRLQQTEEDCEGLFQFPD